MTTKVSPETASAGMVNWMLTFTVSGEGSLPGGQVVFVTVDGETVIPVTAFGSDAAARRTFSVAEAVAVAS